MKQKLSILGVGLIFCFIILLIVYPLAKQENKDQSPELVYTGIVKEVTCSNAALVCRVLTEDDKRVTISDLVIKGDVILCYKLIRGVICERQSLQDQLKEKR